MTATPAAAATKDKTCGAHCPRRTQNLRRKQAKNVRNLRNFGRNLFSAEFFEDCMKFNEREQF